MRIKNQILFSAVFISALSGCSLLNQTSSKSNSGENSISVNNMKANLFYLASPEMEGRETTKRGQKLASKFIESEMMKAGLLPAGDNGTYFQNFYLDCSGVDKDSTYIEINGKKYSFAVDYFGFPSFTKTHKISNADLVFLGYGVKNDSLKINDLAGKDLKDKWVVILSGFPKGIANNNRRDASGAFAKRAELAAAGVAGVINIPNETTKKMVALYASYAASESMTLANMSKSVEELKKAPQPGFSPVFTASEKMTTDLLSIFGLNSKDILDKIENGEMVPSSDKTAKLSSYFVKYIERRQSQNVVGYLPGSDAKLNKTFVGMGAHYDHIGILADGRINYGADDDGSGTTVVLETLKAFGTDFENGNKTKRSLLFVFHTGEEKGLLGSNYLTNHPLPIMDSIRQIIADVNIDMVGRESADTLEVVGHDRLSTDFYNAVEKVNADMKLFTYAYTYNNPNDPADIYKRSDHYNYAKKGIPIVFFTDGMGENWKKNGPEDDYHKPTDTPEKIDYTKMYKVAKLSYELIKRTANNDQAPVVDKK